MKWNYSRTALADDVIFICSCINVACADEIKWPDAARRLELGARIPQFKGCIGFIDGTLVRIRRPFSVDRDLQRAYYNGRKRMHCMNNTVVIDHDGLFIFVDPSYPGTLHDVAMLRNSTLHRNWRQAFSRSNETMEYLLGDRK